MQRVPLGLVAPSPFSGASWRPACSAFPGGGERGVGWVAGWLLGCSSEPCRSFPRGKAPSLLVPAISPHKGLTTEGATSTSWHWGKEPGCPSPHPGPPRPSSSGSTSRLDLVVHKQCARILAVSGRGASARQAGCSLAFGLLPGARGATPTQPAAPVVLTFLSRKEKGWPPGWGGAGGGRQARGSSECPRLGSPGSGLGVEAAGGNEEAFQASLPTPPAAPSPPHLAGPQR